MIKREMSKMVFLRKLLSILDMSPSIEKKKKVGSLTKLECRLPKL